MGYWVDYVCLVTITWLIFHAGRQVGAKKKKVFLKRDVFFSLESHFNGLL